MKTENSELLESFVRYCQEHPDQRFWQALRNWSGYPFILGSDGSAGFEKTYEIDTFELRNRRHDAAE